MIVLVPVLVLTLVLVQVLILGAGTMLVTMISIEAVAARTVFA